MFTSPPVEPSGKIQPYPDSTVPSRVAQLEVRADPRVVGHRGVDVAAARRRRTPCPVPLPAQQLAQRRPDAVGHDQVPALDLACSVGGPERDRGHPAAIPAYVDRPRAVDRLRPGLDRGRAQVVVELGARDRRAPVGQRPARPRQQQRLPEPVRAQPLVDGVRAQPVLEARAAAAPRPHAG